MKELDQLIAPKCSQKEKEVQELQYLEVREMRRDQPRFSKRNI